MLLLFAVVCWCVLSVRCYLLIHVVVVRVAVCCRVLLLYGLLLFDVVCGCVVLFCCCLSCVVAGCWLRVAV